MDIEKKLRDKGITQQEIDQLKEEEKKKYIEGIQKAHDEAVKALKGVKQ